MTTTQKKIKELLIADGIKVSLSGFEHLAIAIEIYKPGMQATKSDGLYQTIAERFNVRWRSVERNMRHCLTKSKYYKENPCSLSEYIAKARYRIDSAYVSD